MKTEFTHDGLMISAQDLSAISPESEDHDRMFHHDGSSSISTVGGSSTTQRGYYVWDKDDQAWYALFHNADKLDGKESGAFVHRDGSLPMEGDLNLDHFGLVETDSVESGTGRLLLNSNHAIFEASSGGSSVRLRDNDGLLLLNAEEGGDVDAPNGVLSEQGDRVATRAWTNANADVPNADYADNANNLDGYDESAFLHVSGDQMEGVLSLGANDVQDGGTTVWDASADEVPQSSLGGPATSLSSYPLSNVDIANANVTVSAGNQLTGGGQVSLGGTITVDVNEGAGSGLDADTVDGDESSDLVHVAGDTMTGSLDVQGVLVSGVSDRAGTFGSTDHTNNYIQLRDSKYGSKIGYADGTNGTVVQSGNAGKAISLQVDSDVFDDGVEVLRADGDNYEVTIPSGALYNQGDRVATRPWTNSNFYDESQADSRFYNVSGDSLSGVLDVDANDVEDGTTTVWDTSVGEVPQSVLGGPAASLNGYPLQNSDLSNSTVTVNAGNQLTGGGSVGLGGSITVDVDENALDADTLDGAHKSDLDSQYVDASGDSMSGNLTVTSDGPGFVHDSSGWAGFDLIGRGDNVRFEAGGDRIFGIKDAGSSTNWAGGSFGYQLLHDGTTQLEAGNLEVPNGQITEQSDRVATRTWVENTSDVPNADYANSAGDSDTLDGEHASAFADAGHLHDSRYILEGGDTMSGVLTLSDGSQAASRSWVNGSADVPNADYADSAGDSNTLDGLDSSQFLRSDVSDTLNATLTVASETKVQFGGSNYFARYDSGRDTLVLGSSENGPVAEVDSGGNLSIEGSLTEGATIGN